MSRRVLLSMPSHEIVMAKAISTLEETATLAKSMVQGYTRMDGTYVKEHDSGRNFHAELASMKHGMTTTMANKKFKNERMDVTRDGDKFHVKPHSKGFPPKRNLSHEEAGNLLQKMHQGEGLVQIDTKHPKPGEDVSKEYGEKTNAITKPMVDKMTSRIKEHAAKQKAAKPKMAAVGDSVHHAGHNKTGTVMKVDGDKYHVLHAGGKDVWDHKDVKKVSEG